MSKIPEYILCPTPELARQVLEKIEREIKLMPSNYFKGSGAEYLSERMFYDMYPLVIVTNNGEFLSFKKLEPNNTNFTKAEDFLNNNYMTEKTWENLQEGWVLEHSRDEFEILAIRGRVIDLSSSNDFNLAGGRYTKEELINGGFKIKGASEDKPSLDGVIEILEPLLLNHSVRMEEAEKISVVIQMLKKLK